MKIISTSLLYCLPALGLQAQNLNNTSDTTRADTTVRILSEITVSASRIKESILQSPVSIQKVGGQYFKAAPAASFFDALENVQGVQMITPSMGFKVLNARGFANTTNVRFAQLVDGMDVQSPHIGGPIANALGPTDLDVDNVEILPGVASALYGMNTINGLANISTKNPFTSPGLSIQQKTAVTHLGDPNSSAKMFSETSVRWAQVITPRLAFKVNAAFMKGYDWIANDHTELNGNANASTGLKGADNPAQDPVNGYGNESSDRKTIALGGKNYIVSRTGYDEKDVVDYGLQNIKADAGIYYKVSPQATLGYFYHVAVLNNVYQRANRFRLEDYRVQQHGLQYQSNAIQLKVYLNTENSGNSYNLRSMAENIDRGYKPDNAWYADYTTAFNHATQTGAAVADAHRQARVFADQGRYQPGTPAFKQELDKLAQINNWDTGAALKVKASFIQAEGQINLTEQWFPALKKDAGLEILAGADHRTYIIVPDGNYFINPAAGKTYTNITYGKTGGFVSVTKSLWQHKLRAGAILRADKNDYFDLNWSPRFTLVFSPVRTQNFRASFQSGYRYPSIFEAYSNVNSGGVKRVGGLPAMSNGIFENAWLQSSITSFQQAVLGDINTNGLSQHDAIVKNQSLLKKNPYTYLKPEHVNSIEGGYKGVFIDGRLFIDADLYFNNYRNFIAQANMNVPLVQNKDSIPFALYNKGQQAQYRMWTNSQTKVYNYGASLGVTYSIHGYRLHANSSYAKLRMSSNEDGLEDGFNTPEWIVNAMVSKEEIVKHTGAGISWKWQSAYYWQSFLVNGQTPAYGTLDAQVNYSFDKLNCKVKIGASNLLNHYYNSFLGGPAIGGMYYVTITYGMK
ncbi:TonB-dependent receptor plug domain-containing protein [Chitinophaga agrisoli]|uniref:TonB-dependent receptor plug domain-containing protein n=1 Tax=Chitinophaga agrisoli TaxID=2607653 RepID=A0A5B2VJV7_9BACT|nr:TonB-dependent receptor [Chitinophaga agrisoli]KAA2238497.1 TonB-dependent receptor plug domain-containing protein [Chitinophaga agrisoli]